MLGALINDCSTIKNLSQCYDVKTTIKCLQECNIKINKDNNGVKIIGGTLNVPVNPLDCKNSGSTARMLLGLLAGEGIPAKFEGDSSLSKRPMGRIISPMMSFH